MQCREGCGACCIAPSITTPFFGMPDGKPAGVLCVHLSVERRCLLFGDARRPAVCQQFAPEPTFCGDDAEQALRILSSLEITSHPETLDD